MPPPAVVTRRPGQPASYTSRPQMKSHPRRGKVDKRSGPKRHHRVVGTVLTNHMLI